MTPEEPNERVKSLIADMEKIGARPAYLRGGSYNDYLAVSYTHLTLPTTPYV